MNKLDQYYCAPSKKMWKGRLSSNDSPNEYWHEQIILKPIDLMPLIPSKDIGILGYQCDEGVKRNCGRPGSIDGPNAIRKQLGKLSWHSKKKVFDYGDIICHQNNMEIAQKVYSDIVKEIIKSGQLSIGIGGGHDLAYGHFCGIRNAIKNSKIGIINFDAHFDLRKPLQSSNSGTPFYQILKEFNDQVNYLPIGIQKFSNPRSLYKIASELKIDHIPIEDCTLNNIKNVFTTIDDFIQKSDSIYLSIDLDGFAAHHAPGVSAPGPFGFSVKFFRVLFEHILKTNKVVAIDIVELNPIYDTDSITAKLASQIIAIAVSK